MTAKRDNRNFPQILYIMGTGRSGTTVLEIILSSSPDTISTGELAHVFQDGFNANKKCACDQPFSTCTFWSKIRIGSGFDESRTGEYVELNRSLEWHTNFLPLVFGFTSKHKIERYIKLQKRIFEEISKIAGKRVIIDSSKYPGRAILLNTIFGSRVKIICLTKSPKGLLASFKKQNVEQAPKGRFQTALYFCYVHLCCKMVSFLRGMNVYFLKYEDLIDDPVNKLIEIQSWSGFDLTESIKKLEEKEYFEVGHILTGNRVRMNKKIMFKPGRINIPPAGLIDRMVCCCMAIFSKLLGY